MSLSCNLNQARRAASQDPARLMSFRYIRDQAMRLLGEHTPTEESLRKMHSERECPAHPDPLVIWALAQVYGAPLEDLSPDTHALMETVRKGPKQPRSRCAVPYAQPALPGFDGQVWVGAAPVRSDGAEHPVQRLVAA